MLTKLQKKKRLAFARSHNNWVSRNWDSVIFSDESRFEVCLGDNRKRVIRQPSEAYNNDCLKRTVKFPKSIMVWGCMSAQGVGQLAFIDGTVNSGKYQHILEHYLLPSINNLKNAHGEYVFQQDGASCHTSRSTRKWLQDNGLETMPWPSSSPDLSPIETLWHEMKKKLRANPARNVQDLKIRLTEIWQSFTPDMCAKLLDTMPKRVKCVIRRKGDVTQF